MCVGWRGGQYLPGLTANSRLPSASVSLSITTAVAGCSLWHL